MTTYCKNGCGNSTTDGDLCGNIAEGHNCEKEHCVFECIECERKLEQIDDSTNQIMDYLRVKYNINSDSDEDDEVYTAIHNIIRSTM